MLHYFSKSNKSNRHYRGGEWEREKGGVLERISKMTWGFIANLCQPLKKQRGQKKFTHNFDWVSQIFQVRTRYMWPLWKYANLRSPPPRTTQPSFKVINFDSNINNTKCRGQTVRAENTENNENTSRCFHCGRIYLVRTEFMNNHLHAGNVVVLSHWFAIYALDSKLDIIVQESFLFSVGSITFESNEKSFKDELKLITCGL